jgi:hypothetical protein
VATGLMDHSRRLEPPLSPADEEIGSTPARSHHLRTGAERGMERPSIYIKNIKSPLFLFDPVCSYRNPNTPELTASDDETQDVTLLQPIASLPQIRTPLAHGASPSIPTANLLLARRPTCPLTHQHTRVYGGTGVSANCVHGFGRFMALGQTA